MLSACRWSAYVARRDMRSACEREDEEGRGNVVAGGDGVEMAAVVEETPEYSAS